MTKLLPCCQCGKSEGYNLSAGSTYRWWVINCKACGGDFGETSADRKVNLQNGPLPERWPYADTDWNDSNKHAQDLRDRIAHLEALIADAPHSSECWAGMLVGDGQQTWKCNCFKSSALDTGAKG